MKLLKNQLRIFTGPTVDRALSDSLIEEFSEICDVPVDLVKDFKTMLTAVNCGHQVDPDKFERAATALVFVQFSS